MSIQTETRHHLISSEDVSMIVHGPESNADKELDDTCKTLVGALAISEGLFHNTTLNVLVPKGDSIGTTSTDAQVYLGRAGAAAYDLLHEGK